MKLRSMRSILNVASFFSSWLMVDSHMHITVHLTCSGSGGGDGCLEDALPKECRQRTAYTQHILQSRTCSTEGGTVGRQVSSTCDPLLK